MTTTFNPDMFLSTLAMSYAMPSSSDETKTTVLSTVTPADPVRPAKRGKAAKAEQQAATAATPATPSIKVGTLDATQFFAAIKVAGKRPNAAGIMMFSDVATQRQDERDAVQGYVGWQQADSHGTNLDRARLAASAALRTAAKTSKEYSRSSKPTMAGYVAGMPNNTRKRLDNLMGRLSKALDDLIQYEAVANDETLPEGTKSHHAGMAALEKERIASINSDLRAMGF